MKNKNNHEDSVSKVRQANYANCLRKLKGGKTLTATEMRIVEEFQRGEEPRRQGRPSKGSQELPVYTSMGECSAATGIPLLRIKAAKDAGCTAFRYSRVELGKLLPFLFQDRPVEATEESGTSWRSEGDKYKALNEKLRYEENRGYLADKREVVQGLKAGQAEVFAMLERIFCAELPPALVGLREIELRDKCQSEIEKVKAALRKRFEEMAKIAGETKEK